MRLNHLDLSVRDVAASRHFFESLLGFRCVETKGRDALSILEDDAGLVLVLSRVRDDEAADYPGQFHIGFMLDTEEAVRACHARFTAAGVERMSPLHTMRGALLFYCHAPGSVLVEVSWRPRVEAPPSPAGSGPG